MRHAVIEMREAKKIEREKRGKFDPAAKAVGVAIACVEEALKE